MEPRNPYPTDLTDQEWALIAPSVPTAKPGSRPEKYPQREILNGILYILRGGCAWRLLPHDFPPGRLSPSPVLLALATGWDLAGDARPAAWRRAGGGGPTPAAQGGHHREPIHPDHGTRGGRGDDAGKQVKGRQRHLVVETRGLLLSVIVPAAHVQDRDGAMALLDVLRHRFSRLRVIWAEQASAGGLIAWVWALRPWRKVRLAIVTRPEGIKGFRWLPTRWIVERTFAWLGRYRRFSKDDEDGTQTSETMLRVAMIHLMVRRLAQMTCF